MTARVGRLLLLPVARPLIAARAAARRVRTAVVGEAADSFFPVHHLPTLDGLLAAHDAPPLTPLPEQAEQGVAGAARFVLHLLASSPRLRRRFPRALSAGPEGAFACRVYDRLRRAGLTPRAAEHARAAFDPAFADRVGHVYDLRDDLRRAFPLGLTPAGRGGYLGWLLRYGRADFGITAEQILWHLFRADEDPGRGLVRTYALQPDWQARLPHALTRFGWPAFKAWVAAEHRLGRPRWLRRAALVPKFNPWDEISLLLQARPDLAGHFPHHAATTGNAEAVLGWLRRQPGLPKPEAGWVAKLTAQVEARLPARPGVNVIGLFRYPSGLQQAAAGMVDALGRAGVRTSLRDYLLVSRRDPHDTNPYDGPELADVTILNTGIDISVPDAYRESGLYRRPGVRRVAVWWWELEQLPDECRGRDDGIDEIWAPTRFIAGAMRSAFGKPVHPMLPGVEVPAFEPKPKELFGLDPAKFAFAFAFDMNSRMPRKNPLGLIRAFRQAFRPDEPVELVLKVTPPTQFYQEYWAELRAAAADAGVTLLDRMFTRGNLFALLNAADAYVSLHRSEGFGLTMAESMLLGKPVIATGYSGNLDFMTDANSYLVRSERVQLAEDVPPYPKGAYWADPDLGHAAELMRRVYENRAEAAAKGERARADLRNLLSPEAAGRRMAARLEQIRCETSGC